MFIMPSSLLKHKMKSFAFMNKNKYIQKYKIIAKT